MHIFRFILSSLGFAHATLDQVRIAYDRFVRFLLIVMLPALIISYLLNIGVSRGGLSPWLNYVPYIIGLVTSLIFMVVAFQPDILILVGVANWAQGKNLLSTDPEFKPWKDFTSVVWFTVAWINIPFMFIGGVPAGANPYAVFAILSTITVISIISKKTIWRDVVMWSATAILSVNLLTLVSQPMWFWLTGDTMHFGATRTEVALTNVLDIIKQTEDKITQQRLDKIANDIKGNRIVSEADTAFRLEQQSKATILPKKLSALAKELIKKSTPQTQPGKPDTPLDPKPVAKTAVAKTPPVEKPAPTVQAPVAAKPVVETWKISFFDNGQLMKKSLRLTRTGDIITFLAADGTKIVVSPAENKGSYVGTITLNNQHPGKCVINLSELVGSGWWEDTPVDIHFALKRIS